MKEQIETANNKQYLIVSENVLYTVDKPKSMYKMYVHKSIHTKSMFYRMYKIHFIADFVGNFYGPRL